MTSYPKFFRKYTSVEPIFVKIGTIVHFDNRSSQKKIQNDSDIFDVVMTSSFFSDDISEDFVDVITASKMSELFWNFSVTLYRQNEQLCQFLRKLVRRKCIFWKTSDMTSYPKKWWRHNSVKNVGINLNFLRWIFTAELKFWVNF